MADNVIETGRSRIEDILLKAYEGQPLSRIEEILLSLYQDLVHLDDQGLIPTELIPPVVFEHCEVVTDDTARFALTTDDVQNGDLVYVNSSQIMYFVVDDTKLDVEAGYLPLAAGVAAKAIADENGNNIASTYQTIIDSVHKLNADYVALNSWTPGSATSHSTPAVGDTITEALQKIDNNQRNDENNILTVNGGQKFSDIMFADSTFSQYVSTDVDGQKIATITATSSTFIAYSANISIAPKKAINIDMYAKTSAANAGAANEGSAIDIRFYDKNGTQIGTKYSMEVMSVDRYGLHRYQCISPSGTAYYTFRAFARKNTTLYIKSIDVHVIDDMPKRDNTGIIYDCHLGCLLYAPKNTWSAYEMAKQMGFNNLIINVKRTSDDVLVCIHDSTIDATSDGTGAVSSFTYEQLLQYDFGSWFSSYYTGEKIPKAVDVIKYASTCGMGIVFSIHSTNTNDDIDDLYTFCAKYGLLGNVLIKSYHTTQLEYAYTVFGDNAKYDVVTNAPVDSTLSTWITTFGHCNYVEFETYASNLINSTNVNAVRALGCEVIGGISSQPNNVNRAIGLGVTRFTSDMCSDMVN